MTGHDDTPRVGDEGEYQPFPRRPGMAIRPSGLAWLIPALILGVGMWAAIIAIAVWIVRMATGG